MSAMHGAAPSIGKLIVTKLVTYEPAEEEAEDVL
jgi:hypothetical protein